MVIIMVVRRRLGVTPRAYERRGPSGLATHFGALEADAPTFYL